MVLLHVPPRLKIIPTEVNELTENVKYTVMSTLFSTHCSECSVETEESSCLDSLADLFCVTFANSSLVNVEECSTDLLTRREGGFQHPVAGRLLAITWKHLATHISGHIDGEHPPLLSEHIEFTNVFLGNCNHINRRFECPFCYRHKEEAQATAPSASQAAAPGAPGVPVTGQQEQPPPSAVVPAQQEIPPELDASLLGDSALGGSLDSRFTLGFRFGLAGSLASAAAHPPPPAAVAGVPPRQ